VLKGIEQDVLSREQNSVYRVDNDQQAGKSNTFLYQTVKNKEQRSGTTDNLTDQARMW
jgi:hypothetical protein